MTPKLVRVWICFRNQAIDGLSKVRASLGKGPQGKPRGKNEQNAVGPCDGMAIRPEGSGNSGASALARQRSSIAKEIW